MTMILNPYRFAGVPSSAVKSLLHYDGTNGSTTFTDEVGNAWSLVGVGPALSTAAAKFGPSSMTVPNNAIISLTALGPGVGAGDFTLEGFANPNSTGSRGLFHTRLNGTAQGIALGHENVSGGQWQVYFDGSVQTANGFPLTAGVWFHWALERVGSTVTLYIDGAAVLSFSSSANIADQAMRVGAYFNNGFFWDGFIDETRFTVGAYQYGMPFTPPASPFTYP